MEYHNKILLEGRIVELTEVFRNDKGGIYEMILDLGTAEKYPLNGLVKLTDKFLKGNQDIAEGAWVKIKAQATARVGKNGKWWGEITAREIAVIEKRKEVGEVKESFDFDDVPF
jgi:hypothetical protein